MRVIFCDPANAGGHLQGPDLAREGQVVADLVTEAMAYTGDAHNLHTDSEDMGRFLPSQARVLTAKKLLKLKTDAVSRKDAASAALGYWDVNALTQRAAVIMEEPERDYAVNYFQSRSTVNPGARNFEIRRKAFSGEAVAIMGASDRIPTSDVGVSYYLQPLVMLVTKVNISIHEKMTAEFANSDLWGDRIKAGMRAIGAKRNHLFIHGDDRIRMFGLTSGQYIPRRRFINPFTTSATMTTLKAEMVDYFYQPWTDSGGAIKPDTLILSGNAHQFVANQPLVTGHPMSALKSLMDDNAGLVKQVVRLDDFNGRGSVVSGSTRRDLGLVARLQGGAPSIYCEDPMKPTLLVDTSNPLRTTGYIVSVLGGAVTTEAGANVLAEYQV